jgi:uncharacterized MAPEG superfamily protein
MTIADYCILIAALMPYVMAGVAKSGAPSFDNAEPRDLSVFTGKARRAWNAHQNCFEVFPFFAISILFAEFRGSSQLWIDALAVLFILIRLVYVYLYLVNKPSIRSSVWSLGLLVTVVLFFLPLIIR